MRKNSDFLRDVLCAPGDSECAAARANIGLFTAAEADQRAAKVAAERHEAEEAEAKRKRDLF